MPLQVSTRVSDIPKFLKEAREAYSLACEVDKVDCDAAKADNLFANASDELKEQWETFARDKRTAEGRPVLQWNRIAVSVQQVVNAGRQNKPSIRVSAGDGGKRETADYFQSRIRHLEYDCNADTARDTARNQQVTSGRGFIRYSVEYVPGTFEQRITIEPIENQFSVVWDPAARLYDRSDADWWMVIDRISREKHIREYGEESIVTRADFTRDDNPAPGWIGVGKNNELIQVAQYWKKEYKARTLALIGAGDFSGMELPIWEDEVPPELKHRIVRTRPDQDISIGCYIINGAEILKETEWLGSSVPIVPLWGRTEIVDGERRTFSLIRNAKDPQRSLNYYVSNIAEQIGMIPKTPWLAPIGSIPAHLDTTWRDVGGIPVAFLLWQQYDDNNPGRVYAKPERVVQEAPIVALTEGAKQCIDGIKAAMGIFDSSLGAAKAEYSGISVRERTQQADITNFHFSDNEARSRKREGEILIELIKKLDRAGKSYPVRSESGETTVIPIGSAYTDKKSGNEVTHDLSKGDYPIVVASGPSYATERKEAYERDAALIQADPELMKVFGDLLFSADDTAGAQERSERVKKWIQSMNPGLIPPDTDKQQAQPDPQALQQQLQQVTQRLQVTQAFAQKTFEELQSKQPELANAVKLKQMDIDFQREKLASDESLGLAKLGIQADIKRLEQQIQGIQHERELASNAALAAAQQAHQQAMQQGDQDHQQDMQAGDQQGAQQLQQGAQDHEADQNAQDRNAAEQAAQNHPEPKAA